ncbi:hypothetical protein M405DRAFT_831707 [Rhizopogon salebrosus TDB-379]|nr:hypothetical protein M405DRAFT_831707 [Rhizopogon salebrosus TDB-379]
MPQAETDALCKNVSFTRTRPFLPRTCTRQFPMKIVWMLLLEALRGKIILMCGGRQETL